MKYTIEDIIKYKRGGMIVRYELGGYSLICKDYSMGMIIDLYDWSNQKIASFMDMNKAIDTLVEEANKMEVGEYR